MNHSDSKKKEELRRFNEGLLRQYHTQEQYAGQSARMLSILKGEQRLLTPDVLAPVILSTNPMSDGGNWVRDRFLSSEHWTPDEMRQLRPTEFVWPKPERHDLTDGALVPFMPVPSIFGMRMFTDPRPTTPALNAEPWLAPRPATAAEIHAAFERASDQLVSDAQALLDEAEIKEAIRLDKLGFDSNPLVRARAKDIRTVREMEKSIPFVVRYAKYTKKFILAAQAERLAKKYGLLIGATSKFIGRLPDKNLAEIEQFIATFDRKDVGCKDNGSWSSRRFLAHRKGYSPMPMEIAAPEGDFDTRGMEKRGARLVDDPIVLQPVVGGYLIVTAWGPEANDPLVTSPKED